MYVNVTLTIYIYMPLVKAEFKTSYIPYNYLPTDYNNALRLHTDNEIALIKNVFELY